MAVKVSAWVWQLELQPYEKLVMLELADHADNDGFCFPKQATIAKRCCISRGAVNRIIKRLEERGLLKQTRKYKEGRQRASEYRLSIGMALYLSAPALPGDVTPGYISESPSVTPIETSVQTSVESSLPAEPGESSVKVEDVLQGKSKSKQSIFEKFEPTPKKCGDFWRDARATASDENGFAAAMKNAHWKMLDDARKKVDDDALFCDTMWKVNEDWVAFTKAATASHGAFNMGYNPSISKFILYIEAAVEYTLLNRGLVQLTAKSLTNKPVSSNLPPKAKPKVEKAPPISLPELLAMNEDVE